MRCRNACGKSGAGVNRICETGAHCGHCARADGVGEATRAAFAAVGIEFCPRGFKIGDSPDPLPPQFAGGAGSGRA